MRIDLQSLFVRLWAAPDILWTRVDKSGDCWVWNGRKTCDGYGSLHIGGRQILAHRAAYFVGNGHIFTGDLICHKCDNPSCCNPAHLFAGSQADNMADMKAKGRRKGVGAGEDNGRAKLTRAIAGAIRAERDNGALLKHLSAKYGVSNSTISRVCRGENWHG